MCNRVTELAKASARSLPSGREKGKVEVADGRPKANVCIPYGKYRFFIADDEDGGETPPATAQFEVGRPDHNRGLALPSAFRARLPVVNPPIDHLGNQ
jgi:hypothetical protein